LPDVVDLAVRECGPEGLLLLLSSHPLVGDAAGERLPARGGVVGPFEYEVDALARQGRLGVDRDDLGVCTVGAQEKSVELSGQVPVRGITAPAGEQARVFAAYCFFGHGFGETAWTKSRSVSKGRPRYL